MQHPQYFGLLITFEGGEGGGKTSQVAALKQLLEESGKEVVSLREPGGTNISEQIRDVVLSTKNKGIADTTEVLLFQAARAQIYSEVVLPALQRGAVVLMDRSRDSSVVYQGIVRGFGKDLIDQFNTFSTQNIYPNITFLLDVSEKVGLQRKSDQDEGNRFEQEDTAFHAKVRKAYLELAMKDKSGRWRIVDASQSFSAVTAELWKETQIVLKEHLHHVSA